MRPSILAMGWHRPMSALVALTANRDTRYGFARGDLEVECPVFPTGMSVGRDSENDIVIRNRSVSREHLMLMPTESGVLVSNLGATNPASVDGSLLLGEALLNPGQSVDVCGVKIGVLAW